MLPISFYIIFMKTMWIQFQKPSIVSILEIVFSGLPFDFSSLSMKKKNTHRWEVEYHKTHTQILAHASQLQL